MSASSILRVLLLVACAMSLTSAAITYTPEALADQITNLPGISPQPTFNQFAGYLTVDAANNRSIFYWYTESQNQPETDPLFWWSNGGPGCSGLLGFLTEHGPFRTAPGGGLEYFPFAFNTLANTLYVEAPAGVGFSYSDVESDYTVGDARTATDNYLAIQQFFQRFPHLLQNSFYISAESYGGHYVPTLAQVIVSNNLDKSSQYYQSLTNFKGFMLGNPLTDMNENMYWGQAGTLCGHSLASKPTCDAFSLHCLSASGPDSSCNAAQSQVVAEAGNLDPYGLDFPGCNQSKQKRRMLQHLYAERMKEPGFSPELRKRLTTIPTPYDPCEENEETTYLNRADVRQAIHTSDKVSSWASCSSVLNYNQSDVNNPMEPIYQYLLQNADLQMVIFSGDDDSICATLGTQHWMFNLLGEDVVSSWTAWNYNSEEYGSQIAGFVTKFKGISLVTVHGAGHMVSGYKPEKGLAVLSNFLQGNFFPTAEETKAFEAKKAASQTKLDVKRIILTE